MATPRRTRHHHQLQPRSRARGLSARRLALAPLLALALTSCFTGERPTFEDGPTEELTGNAEIDAVLTRLDGIQVAQFTADYEILTKLGSRESVATVVQADNSRRSITINAVRYLFDGQTVATCNLDTDECEATINNARTSDLLVTHEFYADAFAIRLRIDADRRIGDPSGYTITQGGQQALCVDVPVSGGTKSYCALEAGPLARYDGNDIFIAMTDYTPEPDESQFATS